MCSDLNVLTFPQARSYVHVCTNFVPMYMHNIDILHILRLPKVMKCLI